MERIKILFFNETLRRWYFKDLIKESKLSRERTNFFLKELIKNRYIKRIKPRGKMPYYVANKQNEDFNQEKRLFGIELLRKNGLYREINSIKEIKSAILFGSFSRGDWNKESDVDLFIFGDATKFDKGKIEHKLRREIQLFNYKDIKILKKELDQKVITNIVKGFNIKGELEPFKVEING